MNRNALKRGIADQNHNFKAKMRLLIIIALFAETVVCNFRTWESIGWKACDMIGESMFSLKDGQYEYDAEGDTSIIAPFREDSWCDLTIFNGEIREIGRAHV